jgi:hypothetical protein
MTAWVKSTPNGDVVENERTGRHAGMEWDDKAKVSLGTLVLHDNMAVELRPNGDRRGVFLLLTRYGSEPGIIR